MTNITTISIVEAVKFVVTWYMVLSDMSELDPFENAPSFFWATISTWLKPSDLSANYL